MANHYKSAILIALSLSDKLGFTEAEMQAGVKNFEKIELRQKLIVAGGRFIYDDTYSSSPEAVRADLEFLKLNFPDKKINAALGDMLELGCETEAAHRKIGSFAKDFGVERLYAFGSYSSLIKEGALDRGFDKEKIYTSDEEDFYVKIAREILKDTTPDEITLIKASHAIKSERIIEELERQYKNA